MNYQVRIAIALLAALYAQPPATYSVIAYLGVTRAPLVTAAGTVYPNAAIPSEMREPLRHRLGRLRPR